MDLLQVGDREVAFTQAVPLDPEPPTEIVRGNEKVDDLVFTHHHHRICEIDREGLAKPAKDRPAATCWPEPLGV
jgi:hypothetical protein